MPKEPTVKVVKHTNGNRVHLTGEPGSRGAQKTLCGRLYSSICRFGRYNYRGRDRLTETALGITALNKRKDICPNCRDRMKGVTSG